MAVFGFDIRQGRECGQQLVLRQIRRAAAAIAVLLLVQLITGSRAWAEDPPTFDSALCHEGTGGKQIVILKSGKAFAFQPGTFFLRTPITDYSAQGDVPQGCPGNPLYAEGAMFAFQFDRMTGKRPGVELPSGVITRATVWGQPGPVVMHQSYLEGHERLKERHGFCGSHASGLNYCVSCYEDPARPGYCEVSERTRERGGHNDGRLGLHAGADFVAPPEVYPVYGDRPFVLSCGPLYDWDQFRDRDCRTSYQLMEGVFISYDLDAEDITPDDILPIDRAYRDQVLAARRPDYDIPPIQIRN